LVIGRFADMGLRGALGAKIILTGKFSASALRRYSHPERGAHLLQKRRVSEHFGRRLQISSIVLCLLAACLMSSGQELKPLVFTTTPRQITARITTGEQEQNLKLPGKASFSITSANKDDTVTGTVVLTIANDARRIIAELTGNDLELTPSSYSKKNIIAHFRKGTACPEISLEISKIEMDLGGVTACLDRFSPVIKESPEQISLLFCSWARQINTDRHRLGIIAAINRLLIGDPEK
jgi:hypothetical protein